MSRTKQRASRGRPPGPSDPRALEIPVLDARGDQTRIYEREFRQRLPVNNVERMVVGYELDTGERVSLVGENTFVSVRTGEKFIRLK